MFDSTWKLRLFFSVDLVGSTAYKVQQSKSEAPEWSHTFREFFRDFPTVIDSQASQLDGKYPKCAERLRPWKFSGDEILFWVQLGSFTEAVSHIAAFKRALIHYPDKWKRQKVPLSLKATAWIAGFPVTNSEIQITHDQNTVLDFIGPSIDAGFRITKYASSRRFVLSADLALMLLDAIHDTELPCNDFHLYYDGSESLKGVLDGKPYPLVWLDMNNGEQDLEEELLGIKRQSLPHILREFLAKFVDGEMTRPFIENDPNGKYDKVCPQLQAKRDRMVAMEIQVTETGQGNEATSSATEPAIPDPIKNPDSRIPSIDDV